MRIISSVYFAMALAFAVLISGSARADETAVVDAPLAKTQAESAPVKTVDAEAKNVEPQDIELADGKLVLPVPGDWKTVKPKSRIIRHEFSIPAAKEDKTPGRMTIMAAGGGIEANIARWAGQFQTAEGKPLGDDDKKVTEKKVGDLEVHLVDLTGTYNDSMRGPFGPKVKRPGYRMLAAIIPLKQDGTWFIKFYGPQATVKAAEKAFQKMIDGMTHAP